MMATTGGLAQTGGVATENDIHNVEEERHDVEVGESGVSISIHRNPENPERNPSNIPLK